MTLRSRSYVLVYDRVALRASAFASLIEKCLLRRDVDVAVFPRRAGEVDLDPSACCLCVVNIDAFKLVSVEAQVQVGVAASLFPAAPMMILAADVDEHDLALATDLGVDALVTLESGVDVMARAIEAVLDGGVVMPTVPPRPAATASRTRVGGSRNHLTPVERLSPRAGSRSRTGAPAGRAVGDDTVPQLSRPKLDTLDGEAPAPGAPRLTHRQVAVLDELRSGKSNKAIARTLDLAEATVKIHVRELMRKLSVNNRTQLAIISLGGSTPNVRITDGSDLPSVALAGSSAYELRLSGSKDTRPPPKWMP